MSVFPFPLLYYLCNFLVLGFKTPSRLCKCPSLTCPTARTHARAAGRGRGNSSTHLSYWGVPTPSGSPGAALGAVGQEGTRKGTQGTWQHQPTVPAWGSSSRTPTSPSPLLNTNWEVPLMPKLANLPPAPGALWQQRGVRSVGWGLRSLPAQSPPLLPTPTSAVTAELCYGI